MEQHQPPPGQAPLHGGGPSTTMVILPGPPPQLPPPVPQLPPQMFTTAAQLLDLTDKKLLVSLRDGRRLIGILRSWDQFANLVLQHTVERICVPTTPQTHPSTSDDTTTKAAPSSSSSETVAAPAGTAEQRAILPRKPPVVGVFADEPRGIFLVRGENVLLMGEIDLDLDDDPPPGYEKAELAVVKKLAKERKEEDARRQKRRLKALAKMGFEGENMGEVLI